MFKELLLLFLAGYLATFLLFVIHAESDLVIPSRGAHFLFVLAGVGAVCIGLVFPFVDVAFQHKPRPQEWSTVLRSMLGMIGIALAGVKLSQHRSMELNMSLTLMAVSLWWLIDGSRVGFITASAITALCVVVAQYLSYAGINSWVDPDFFYIHFTFIPALFMASLSLGLLGRQLHPAP